MKNDESLVTPGSNVNASNINASSSVGSLLFSLNESHRIEYQTVIKMHTVDRVADHELWIEMRRRQRRRREGQGDGA